MKRLVSLILSVILCLPVFLMPVAVAEQAGIGSPDSPVEVKILMKDVSGSEEDVQLYVAAVEKGMAEEGNYVKLTYLDAPAGKYVEVVPLAIRTGTLAADIIYFQNDAERSVAAEGLLEDLTPYIEKSVNVKSLMQPFDESCLKNYPYMLWLSPARVGVPVVRKDFFDQTESGPKLMADPTVENWTAFLKELKDKGLVQYPFTLDNSPGRIESPFNAAFGETSTILKENGEWVYARASQGEKAKLEWLSKLYADGLLDPEFVTNTWDVMEQRFYTNVCGIVTGTAGAVVKIYNDKMTAANGPQAELICLPPMKGVAQSYLPVNVTKESRGFTISVDSQVKDAAFAVLEFLAGPKGRLLDLCGIEGKHYNITDGKIVFTDKYPEWWPRGFETTKNFNPETPLAQPLMPAAAEKSLELIQQYYAEDINIVVPDDMIAQWDAMTQLYNEYSTDIIRGVKPVSAFDEFVEKWNAAGGDAFKQILKDKLG
jgi:putative aldouronate transport system substrate-binding protein